MERGDKLRPRRARLVNRAKLRRMWILQLSVVVGMSRPPGQLTLLQWAAGRRSGRPAQHNQVIDSDAWPVNAKVILKSSGGVYKHLLDNTITT